MTEKKTPISPELQRRKDEAKRLADKYCTKDGGKPDLEAVAELPPLEYDQIRKELADRVGVRVSVLDAEIAGRRPSDSSELPEDPAPWETEVRGDRLLRDLVVALKDHLVLTSGLAETIALWVLFAHAHDAFEASPVLAVTSPTPECGKTTLLTVLGQLVPRPLPASNITGAAFFRAVDKWKPSVLIDEADTFLRDSDELRGILNSGHNRRNAWIIRTQGDNHEPRRFSTWAAKAIALIGKLPPTLSSRSLHIKVQRKLATDAVTLLRADRLDHLTPLHRKAARWASDNAAPLKASDPEMPAELQSRAADNWRPLIAIADLAGGEWPTRSREIARNAAAEERSEIAGIMVLADLKAIFDRRDVPGLHTDEIIAELVVMEDRPWAEWKAGREITKNQLAKLLGAFEIGPTQVWSAGRNKRGYELRHLKPVFERYLAGASPPQSARVLESLASNGLGENQSARTELPLALQKGVDPLELNGSSTLALPEAEASADKASFYCSACDDLGCPSCEPERFGLPPRRAAP